MPKLFVALVATIVLLSGCGGMRLVDADVQAVTTLAPDASDLSGAHYRFERLPSQAAQAQFPRIETLAEAALARVGLVRDDAGAHYSAQVSARVESFYADPWGQPLGNPWWPGGYGQLMMGSGFGWGMGLGYHTPPSTSYRREVTLLLRDLRSGQVVYETRARHDGPWHDTDNVLAAMFDAALKDFPHPPAGMRRVNIEIPR